MNTEFYIDDNTFYEYDKDCMAQKYPCSSGSTGKNLLFLLFIFRYSIELGIIYNYH